MLILKILGFFLGVDPLQKFLTYLNAKANNETERERLKTEVTIEEIKGEIDLNNQRRLIVQTQLGTPIAWFPRFLAELFAVLYFMAIVIDKIFNLPGEVSDLPTPIAALMGTIFAGMFLARAADNLPKAGK